MSEYHHSFQFYVLIISNLVYCLETSPSLYMVQIGRHTHKAHVAKNPSLVIYVDSNLKPLVLRLEGLSRRKVVEDGHRIARQLESVGNRKSEEETK